MRKIIVQYDELNSCLKEFSKLVNINQKTLNLGKKILFFIIKNNLYDSFHLDFSLKIGKNDQKIIPKFRSTHYTSYDLSTSQKQNLHNQARKISIKLLFKKYKILNKENNKIIDYFFKPCFSNNFLYPVQLGIEIDEKCRPTFKIFKNCSTKFISTLTADNSFIDKRIINKNNLKNIYYYFSELLLKYFNGKGIGYLKNKHIGIMGAGFKNNERGSKVYLIYEDKNKIISELKKVKFNSNTIFALNKFIDRNKNFLKKEMALCLDTNKDGFYPKKIDFYFKNSFLGDKTIIKKVSKEIFSIFGYKANSKIYNNKLGKNIYSFSVGEDFITFYYGYGIWNLKNIFIK